MGMPVATGLRERKKIKTQEALMETALNLFEQQGFEHTTIEEITASCEMSPRTFFRYFPNKESVLLGDAQSRSAELIAALAEQPPEVAPLEAIRSAMLILVATLQHDRVRLVRRSRVIAATPSLRVHKIAHKEEWRDAILELLVQRETASDQPASSRLLLHLVAATSLGALEAAVETWLEEGGDLTAIVNRSFDAIAAGLH
jgi:AcrR family transcriptional regulator